MLKSIYFYRNNPLHFHILVNKLSEKVISTLFNTWAVPEVKVSFYNISDSIVDVRWVPNSHYSGVHGLLKLVFPKIIPLSVTEKIIILDTDLSFNGDILELWQLFKKFSKKQGIGLVDNQSFYYLENLDAWPVIGRGYNTGVMLYHLKVLKEYAWETLWVKLARKAASAHGAARLADQDVINFVIKSQPDILFDLPCQWNIQVHSKTLSPNCYQNQPIKIMHWNSPQKFKVVHKDIDYFKSLYNTFVEYNGNLLKRQLFDCSNTTKNNTNTEYNICAQFDMAQNNSWRTLLFFKKFDYSPTKHDVTLATQLSFDRLQMIEELCRFWNGPLSITLYVTDPEFQESINFIEQSSVLEHRSNIAYHAVFKNGANHPINFLRNVGLKNVNTPYVFLTDIDFIPMLGLYNTIKHAIRNMKDMEKKALIIPAFQTQGYKTRIPKSKIELLQMMDDTVIQTFRHDVWPAGHAPTNYEKWKTARASYSVKWERDYEPYIVVKKEVVEYDNRFMGFGWNKVSHIMELEAQGYTFIVLPTSFIVHKPHAPSYDIAKFRHSPVYRMCIQNLKEEFVNRLKEKYGRAFELKSNNSINPEVLK